MISLSEIICVPIGTLIIRSFPFAPLQFFPDPSVPFLALGTAYIFLNEQITLNVIIGGLFSLIAIYLVNKK